MLTDDEARSEIVRLSAAHHRDLAWCEPLRAAVRNRISTLYVPADATHEYRRIVRMSRYNICDLAVGVVAQQLYVDGYRQSDSDQDAPAWDAVWETNRMGSRQRAIHRGALTYGYSYATVMPGAPVPVVRPCSPRLLTADYEDESDEWPRVAAIWSPRSLPTVTLDPAYLDDVAVGSSIAAGATAHLLDDTYRWTFTHLGGDRSAWELTDKAEHGLGVCPAVRYLDSSGDSEEDGDPPPGKIAPLLPVQAQLNQLTFSLLMAAHHGAFKLAWATGVSHTDEEGNPVRPPNPQVNRLLTSESPDTRFGQFSETDLNGYLNARDKAVMFAATTSQMPPHALVLSSGLSNVSAEAINSLGQSHQSDVAEHKATFGESHEQLMRLCAAAMGDNAGWDDTSSEVIWRDTTPRSLAEVADALGKLATMLEIPARALWARVPGVTPTELATWASMADDASSQRTLEALAAMAREAQAAPMVDDDDPQQMPPRAA